MNDSDKVHPGFLKVKGRFDTPEEEKKYCKKLASAVVACLQRHGLVEMRCIGRNATYNCIKSLISASAAVAPMGCEIMWTCSYDIGNIGELARPTDALDVTAIKICVKDFNTVKMNEFKSETESREINEL